ncbi:rho guanine nucleotide exchange factor 17 isoform X2 [Oryzias latipes]|uniref:rho guanine nucleotide exchange factor 17 isoform X2 n=1 Tax=Oryzias latipes TaxID=8090 RepID=UPI0009DAF4F9|nr:rho guanine nucleotide exchange factor 17 isoform X2 [Oryzias latipes]
MAERGRKNTLVYRSVSFRKLGSVGAGRSEEQHKSEAAGAALPAERSDAAGGTRTASRKVSKLTSSAGLPTAEQKRAPSALPTSISPSFRQLTERFSSARTPGAALGGRSRSSRRKSFAEEENNLQDSDSTTAAESSSEAKAKLLSSTDSLSGSDSERKTERGVLTRLPAESRSSPGKRDYSQVNVRCSEPRKAASEEEEDGGSRGVSPPCKTHRRYLSAHHKDFSPPHPETWPSVTRIRQLFDEKESRCLQNLKAADRGLLLELSCPPPQTRSRESLPAKETFCRDRISKGHVSKKPEADVGPKGDPCQNCCGHYCGIKRTGSPEVEHKTPKWTGSTSDPGPDLQPGAASSFSRSETSSCSSSIQQPTQRGRRDRQGVGLPRDSLHSSHSSSREPAPTFSSSAPDKAITSSSSVAPSSELETPQTPKSLLWRFSSGDEEEVQNRRRRGGGWGVPPSSSAAAGREGGATERGASFLSRSKNDCWATKGFGRSSGSEEDSPSTLGSHCQEAARRRSLRKKKKVAGSAPAAGRDDYNHDDAELEDSDSDLAVTMDPLERQQQNTGGMVQRSHSAREASVRSNRARVQHWERISSPVTSSTLPGVSRVAKVSIPPFASGDSRCSSRYSSSETLKVEDPTLSASHASKGFLCSGGTQSSPSRAASSSMLSKTYHGNFTMYRSPSFGHGDNFSRSPVRPKLVPTVLPSPSPIDSVTSGVRRGEKVMLRKTGGGILNEKNKIQISTSNPDISSETITLLNFLKSDLSGLRVHRTSVGDRAAGVESSSAYKKDSGPPHKAVMSSSHRPSLKDLTATLRRAKSFTYSDKPSIGARCYLKGGATRRSSSEEQLDLDGEAGEVMSEREVESDGGDIRVGQRIKSYGHDEDDDEEVMQTPMQRRCAQEARQVIQDICQMCTRSDEEDDAFLKRASGSVRETCSQFNGTGLETEKVESIKDERRAEGAEFEEAAGKDKHEQETGERSGQRVQLEKLLSTGSEGWEKPEGRHRALQGDLLKGDSEENMLYEGSVDERSGHESSLTDEGIVTEPEMGPSDLLERSLPAGLNLGSRMAREELRQPVDAWKHLGLCDSEEKRMESSSGGPNRLSEVRISCLPDLTASLSADASEGVHVNPAASQGSGGGGFEAPATPGAVRRRRKFSPSNGNNTGSDSNCGSHAESAAAVGNGESTVYRSLSDPMPQRRCSAAGDGNKNYSSVDSNFLGSLSVKGAGGGPSEASDAAAVTEYKGSVASDLSVCSDGGLQDDSVRDYSGVIKNIVSEPGAMDNLVVDDHSNGKAPKKKSFSDPSRRSDALLLSQNDPQLRGQAGGAQPISELEQSGQIPPSSSEPILSEQRGDLWEPKVQPARVKVTRSQSESCPKSNNDDEEDGDMIDQDGEEEVQKFNFNLKLAEVLSPRLIRRPTRKRPNRLFVPQEDPFEPLELGPDGQQVSPNELASSPPLTTNSKTALKHVRHTSEPATFIPISPAPHLQPLKEAESITVGPPADPEVTSKPAGEEAPSLEDVTQKYILELNASERDTGAKEVSQGSASSLEAPGETGIGGLVEAAPQKKDNASVSAPQRTKPRVDMRKHVMMTLLDTEQSYVESLRSLVQGYMRPLKQPDSGTIVDPLLVDEMFYQIPEILEHHEHFLDQVSSCVSQWHDRQTIGHILVQSFSKEALADMYSAYIDNFLNARDAVRIAKEAKPAFHKFLENMRENKEKQALGDLMIKPVQRIPRYELLVKDLLKHTPEDHPDHSYLMDAQRDIKRLAEKINKGRRSAEEAEREARVIQEIEAHIEGVEHILNPQRKFLRQEIVMEAKTVGGKKDRSLFLFSDLIICTTLKRKSGSLRRSSMSLYTAASVIDTTSKYKFLWKLPLEEVEVVKSSTQATNKESIQKMISRLEEDLSTMGQISKLSETLSFPHLSLDEVIKDLMASVHKELSEKQSLAFSMTFLPTKLEFTTVSAESTFVFEFSSPDALSSFEQAFEDAKKKLAMNKDQWDPEFLKAIPIMKTRSGMQFSCASPSHSCPDSGCEVWVCNSDGYVGQVCLLNIKDEPTVEACIAVCSARIICIAAVPGLKGRDRGSEPTPSSTAAGHSQQQQLHISISRSTLELAEQPTGPGAELVPFDSDDTDDEDSPSPSSTLQSQASHSTISSSFGNDEGPGSKDMATETTSSEEEQEFPVAGSYSAPGMLGVGGGSRALTESPMDGRAMRRSSRGSFTRASLEDLLSIDPEAYQSSVWLGTEDGCIHVYQSSDNIRNRKNSMKMQHAASILCILFFDNKVFVSLANGEVIVYQRDAGSFWDPQSSQTLVLGTPRSPVTKMVPVGGKLWCGSQNKVLIINPTTLVQEHWFQVGTDSSRCVICMVAYGHGVWLALQGSAQVRLYHAQTWESLTEVDVAPAVHKMLAGADAIIRQHKAACLRITALLACKDLLWIGTSAGVVLTLAIPAVTSGTGAGTLKSSLVPMGSAHGHTGHVRFLTSIELPEGFDMNFPPTTTNSTGNLSQSSSTVEGGLQRRDSAHRRTSAHIPPKTNHLVISGGDGYEDFRLTNSSETVGRDDSTNHLLLWRV